MTSLGFLMKALLFSGISLIRFFNVKHITPVERYKQSSYININGQNIDDVICRQEFAVDI